MINVVLGLGQGLGQGLGLGLDIGGNPFPNRKRDGNDKNQSK